MTFIERSLVGWELLEALAGYGMSWSVANFSSNSRGASVWDEWLANTSMSALRVKYVVRISS